MKKYILLQLALLTLNSSYAQSWNELDLNTDERLNKIHFTSDEAGYIIGDNGLLLKTIDGGNNWVATDVGVSLNLMAISFVGNNVGYINGLKTIDGGITWFTQTASEEFGLIHALDENNLIAGLADDFSGDIYKSSDGGDSWEIIANPIFPLAGAYNDVCFINDELGYLSAWYSEHLVKTIDGGDNWIEIVIDIVDGADFSTDDFRAVDFPTENIGLVTHENGILKTSDAGNTWSEIKPDNLSSSFYPEKIIALSTDNYIVVGGFPNVEIEKIYETTDGGTSWTESVNILDALFDVACTSANCFAVGSNGKVYRKENTTSTNNELSENSTIKIYPNPTQDFLNIENSLGITEVRIFNIEGKLLNSYSGNNRIDIAYLNSGIYFIKVISDETIFTSKVIKK
ncbi:MAG: YCF48-related protein [Lewinella sp.]